MLPVDQATPYGALSKGQASDQEFAKSHLLAPQGKTSVSPYTHFLKQEGENQDGSWLSPRHQPGTMGTGSGGSGCWQETASVALRGTKASPTWRPERGNSYQGEGESWRARQGSEPTISRA